MKNYILLVVLSLTITCAFGQATFQKRYGGYKDEIMTGLTDTYDGGYVMSGGSMSFGDTTGDIYLLKTDRRGILQWSMVYRGPQNDFCNKVIETTDHGLLLVGQT